VTRGRKYKSKMYEKWYGEKYVPRGERYRMEVKYPDKTDRLNLSRQDLIAEVFRVLEKMLKREEPIRGFTVEVAG